MSTVVGPIIKNTTYRPSFDINSYPVTYIIDGYKCQNSKTPVGSYVGSKDNTKIVYNYVYNTPLPSNDTMDVTCTTSSKTFVGWTNTRGGSTPTNVNVTSALTVFPIFADKISVSVKLGNNIVYQTFVDSGITVNKRDLLSSAITQINAGGYSNNYNISSMADSIELYTTSDCKSVFSSTKVTVPVTLFIKPDPYITFELGSDDSKATFSDGQRTSKKIPLSELSKGSKIPSATTTEAHRVFTKWVIQTSTPLDYPQVLMGNTEQLKDYNPVKYYLPVTYKAYFDKRKYTVIFRDESKNCSSNTETVITVEAETIIDKNIPEFQKLNCSKSGHTFKGWYQEKFTTQSYCPAINLIVAIALIVVIAFIVKYIADGISNGGFRSSVLRGNQLL